MQTYTVVRDYAVERRVVPEDEDESLTRWKSGQTIIFNEDFKKKCGNFKLTMPLVKLFYGPYEVHGITKHRHQKLHGLVQCLEKRGFSVELIPSPHIDRLEVEVLGKIVYRANIKFFLFNHSWNDDKVCYDAIHKIHEAILRLYSTMNIPTIQKIASKDSDPVLLKYTSDNDSGYRYDTIN